MKPTIGIHFVEQQEQRYDTAGDYYFDTHGQLQIVVSRTGDGRADLLIAIHELVEAVIVLAAGQPHATLGECREKLLAIDKFDMEWKPHNGITEPGDDPEAPYYEAHQRATTVEILVADSLGLKWSEYSELVDKLTKEIGK